MMENIKNSNYINQDRVLDISSCRLCPRSCGVNRHLGQPGFCGCDEKIYAARAALHMWEEPCISGKRGSGAVFFSGCNLRCVFCQNHEISAMQVGKEITDERLYEIFFELKDKGAANINLVTPTHYVHKLVPVIKQARKDGIGLPFIYNSGGYEGIETLKALEGLIDVYLPDFKYMDPELARKYSMAHDYPEVVKKALAEMVRQTGPVCFKEGYITRGVIVRHLILPGRPYNSLKVIDYLHRTYGNDIYISLMSQYTPMQRLIDEGKYPELSKCLDRRTYDMLVSHAMRIGVENGYIQEGGADSESFIPLFNYEGL